MDHGHFHDKATGVIREDVSADVISAFLTGERVESFVDEPRGSVDQHLDAAVRKLLPLIKP